MIMKNKVKIKHLLNIDYTSHFVTMSSFFYLAMPTGFHFSFFSVGADKRFYTILFSY